MTEPLTPPGCDMSGNDWFPLYFRRLRQSKWWRRASDLARARNVMLWGQAYQAVPAGSLPDDDDELAEAAGFGFDVEAFLAAKAEIMAPWVLCSDGRWYHPTVCEAALNAWDKLGEKRRAERERKASQRASTRSKGAAVPPKSDVVPRDTSENSRDIALHREDTGQDRTITPQPPGGSEGTFDQAFALYPQTGRSFTHREVALGEWLKACERETPDRLLLAVKTFAASDVAAEEKGRRVPKFERWLRESRFAAWLPSETTTIGRAWLGPAEVRAAVVDACGEAFAVSWLDPCGWRDLPDRTVIAHDELTAKRLRERVGDLLEELGVTIKLEAIA